MKSVVIAFLTCLLVLYVQGQSDTRRSCRCSNGFVSRIHPKLIKGIPEIHNQTVFCPQIEIIITTTANKLKCVDPESPLGKTILKNMKKKENEAVSTMLTAPITTPTTTPTTTTTTTTTTPVTLTTTTSTTTTKTTTTQTKTQNSTSHHTTSTTK